MSNHEIILLLVVLTLLILSLAIHEAAHAFVAYRCGDDTAKHMGRLTLNPIDHIDPFMTIMLPAFLWFSTNGAFVFGGAKPVPVNPYNLRNPSRDMMYVSLAGPISNFLLAIIFMVAFKGLAVFGHYPNGSLMMSALKNGAVLNVVLAVFNLTPIPPLDGSRVVMHFLPQSKKHAYAQIERYGIFIIIGLLYLVPGTKHLLFACVQEVWSFLDFITGGRW
ncbi:MAG: site-2 protease family protein [bacterium]|nr:site-2 protease family protein [bacterium]